MTALSDPFTQAANKRVHTTNPHWACRHLQLLMAAPTWKPAQPVQIPQWSDPRGSAGLPLAGSNLDLGHIKPCLPQPWTGFLLLQGCNSRNKESRSHPASTFPESLESHGWLDVVTDDELGAEALGTCAFGWAHKVVLACPLPVTVMTPEHRDHRILASTSQKGYRKGLK